MHLTSTINPLTTSDGNVPVAIFCYEGKKRFIQVSESYEETVQRVGASFGITETPSRVTTFRTSSIDACRGEEVEIDASAYPHVWSVLGEVTVALEEREGAPVQGQVGVLSAEGARQLPTPTATPLGSVPRQEGPVAGPSKVADVPSKEKPRPQEYFDPRFDDEDFIQEQEEAPKPITGSKLLDRLDEMTDQGEPQRKFKAPTLPPVVTNTEFPKMIKKEKVTVAVTDSSPAVETSSPRKATAGPGTQGERDDRFEITINGPGPGQVAQFKTRGKHTVRKVLAAACKTFDIDDQNAHLFFLMSIPDDDGTMATHEFECMPDDTMAQCTIDSSARLFVTIGKDDAEQVAEDDDDDDD